MKERLRAFGFWGFWVGLAFFAVYPATNWLTSLRSEYFVLYLDSELGMPFVPEFIWLYLSMYALFALPPFFLEPDSLVRLGKELILATLIAGLVFLLLPAKLGFARGLPEDALYGALFAQIFSIDMPYNLVPSLHVVYTTAIAWAIMATAGRTLRILLAIWIPLVLLSTVLVHQHHLLDVAAGFVLVVLVRSFWEKRNA